MAGAQVELTCRNLVPSHGDPSSLVTTAWLEQDRRVMGSRALAPTCRISSESSYSNSGIQHAYKDSDSTVEKSSDGDHVDSKAQGVGVTAESADENVAMVNDDDEEEEEEFPDMDPEKCVQFKKNDLSTEGEIFLSCPGNNISRILVLSDNKRFEIFSNSQYLTTMEGELFDEFEASVVYRLSLTVPGELNSLRLRVSASVASFWVYSLRVWLARETSGVTGLGSRFNMLKVNEMLGDRALSSKAESFRTLFGNFNNSGQGAASGMSGNFTARTPTAGQAPNFTDFLLSNPGLMMQASTLLPPGLLAGSSGPLAGASSPLFRPQGPRCQPPASPSAICPQTDKSTEPPTMDNISTLISTIPVTAATEYSSNTPPVSETSTNSGAVSNPAATPPAVSNPTVTSPAVSNPPVSKSPVSNLPGNIPTVPTPGATTPAALTSAAGVQLLAAVEERMAAQISEVEARLTARIAEAEARLAEKLDLIISRLPP